MILIDQYRVPVGGRCLELPAGLVGDEDPNATVEDTAIKELEEETGFTAERIERARRLLSLAGHGLRKASRSFARTACARSARAAGTEHEDINVHLVARDDIPAFVERSAPKASRSTSSC